MQNLSGYLRLSPGSLEKLLLSLVIFIALAVIRYLLGRFIRHRAGNAGQVRHWRRVVTYAHSTLIILLIGPVWVEGLGPLTTFLGLASAGVAIAMHDTIANIAGWVFIVSRRPFGIGDRIQIGDIAGDVIDLRLFQFSLVEIGHWVDADQSTGRIVHVPNSKVLREPLANYHIGFAYIWNEIPVLVTFESNWRKAKGLLEGIARDHVEHLSEDAKTQIRRAAEKYHIFYGALTPVVYTTVKDSGVLLTIRYLVEPRQRRSTNQQMWESTLDAFRDEDDIELAYPTTRFYSSGEPPANGGPLIGNPG